MITIDLTSITSVTIKRLGADSGKANRKGSFLVKAKRCLLTGPEGKAQCSRTGCLPSPVHLPAWSPNSFEAQAHQERSSGS